MIIFRQKNFGFMGVKFNQTVNNFNKMKNATGFGDKLIYGGKTAWHAGVGGVKSAIVGAPVAALGAGVVGTAGAIGIDNVGNN